LSQQSGTAAPRLGLAAAIAVVTGESIALGIFLTPAAMAKSLGSPLLLAMVWLAMAAMAICGALCYSELAVRFPESGGEYVYLRSTFGEIPAFLYGWMSAIVMYPGVAAALAVGAAPYFAQIVPGHSRLIALFPAAILCSFCAINLIGTRFSGAVMSVINLLKIALLLLLVVWAFVSHHVQVGNLLPLTERRPGSDPLAGAITGGIVSAFFSFGGWWEAGKIAGDVRNPQRNLPLAFLGGVSVVTVVYLVISGVFLSVVPIGHVTSDTAFVAQFGSALFGQAGSRVLSWCVLVCVLGGIAALTMAAPRVVYAMSRNGAFLPSFGKLNPHFGTPARAILLQTALSLLVLSLGAFDRVLSFIIFSAVLFLAITVSTLFWQQRPAGRWYPVAPIVFIVFSIGIDVLILMHDPVPALIGVCIVLAGLPLRRLFAPALMSSQLIRQRSGP
jgi:basic amino acid/polyamine antiporter, APA family